MKKILITAITCAMLASSAGVLAEQETALLTAAPQGYIVTVNGDKADFDKYEIFKQDSHVMMPLRAVAEKLGFKVEWNSERQGITLDNKEVNTTVYIGKDTYYMASSFAIGMSAPTPLGAAPVLKNDTTYVPAEMFDILCGSGTVTVDGSNIIIKTENRDSDATQIPNPITEYKTVEDAEKATSFKAKLPSKLPDGYKMSFISVISGEILNIFYSSGTNEICYRMAKGDEDISGDYNIYDDILAVQIGGLAVTVRGSGGLYSSAVWHDGEFSCSLYSTTGLDESEFTKIIKSMQLSENTAK